jgi:hypothetical protein
LDPDPIASLMQILLLERWICVANCYRVIKRLLTLVCDHQ